MYEIYILAFNLYPIQELSFESLFLMHEVQNVIRIINTKKPICIQLAQAVLKYHWEITIFSENSNSAK